MSAALAHKRYVRCNRRCPLWVRSGAGIFEYSSCRGMERSHHIRDPPPVRRRTRPNPSTIQCPLWVTCGRRLGKNFLTLLQHWSGRSRVRPVDAAGVAAGADPRQPCAPRYSSIVRNSEAVAACRAAVGSYMQRERWQLRLLAGVWSGLLGEVFCSTRARDLKAA